MEFLLALIDDEMTYLETEDERPDLQELCKEIRRLLGKED